MVEDNSHAGQGPVVLDIGGDIGALVIAMPAALAGCEIEARPVAGAAKASYDAAGSTHSHFHSGHHHHHSHGAPLVHVGVLQRAGAGGVQHSAVFSELQDGEYEFYVRPDGPVQLTATVRGGEVSTESWPGS
jgi:hypothetical protein